MSNRSDRGRDLLGYPTEGPTWPKSVDAVSPPSPNAAPEDEGAAIPYLRRPTGPERKVTLRDLPAPAPNRSPTLPYADRLPNSDPLPAPDALTAPTDVTDAPTTVQHRDPADAEVDEVTRMRFSEPVPFYIERDSVPAPAPDPVDSFDETPTRTQTQFEDATTQIKQNQRPSAMNLGKLASPRFAVPGEPVRIATAKPSAMRLNRVEPLLDMPSDAITDAPVETPSSAPRPSLSGQRLHRALPILTGLSFIAIGAATTVILLRGGNSAVPDDFAATGAAPRPTQAPRPAAKPQASPPPAIARTTPSPTPPVPSAAASPSSRANTHHAQPVRPLPPSKQAPRTKVRPPPTGIPDESPF